MSFDSLEFLLFLPVVTLLHWLCPGRWRWVVLLAASYWFYMSWNAELSALILGVSAVTWLAGLALSREGRPGARRAWLVLALAVCLGLLGFFKYFNFLGETAMGLLSLLGGTGRWTAWDIVLPVGVSFYTFQALSYVIDVYRGDLPAQRHFGYYALYISFFPQLVAGPIERAGSLLPQLRGERRFSKADAAAGGRLLLSGFFRKVVVADFCGRFADAVYGCETAPDGSAVLIGTVLFAFQIYCDFAGYSEIAAGSARLLGVRLMENFRRPYLAGNIRDFWRRWHISLTGWLTDYVYIPLGGSRRGLGRQVLATLAVFAVSGLWHGARWTFVAWGLLHGCCMVLSLLWGRAHPQGPPPARWRRACSTALTFAAVCFAWIFFRANSLPQALAMVKSLFSPWRLGEGLALLGLGLADLLWAALALALLPALHRLTRERGEGGGPALPDMGGVLLLMAVVLAWLVRLEQGGGNAFIYFQF